MRKINAVSFGVGVIGSLTARHILENKSEQLNLMGAYDVDPSKVGKDLSEVIGHDRLTGVRVSNNLEEVLTKDVDISIHATTSHFEAAYPQIESVLSHGVDVVSSCEELSYPYAVNERLANKLNSLARKQGATVLGTGINPGFLMDVLPITLTAPCKEVRRIRVSRRMDAATRRVPFQRKIGAGMAENEFYEAIRNGSISGHVGLKQSIAMVADAIGWRLDEVIVGEVEPVVAESPTEKGYKRIVPGQVAGVRQVARGLVKGNPVIELNFSAYVGSEEEYDTVEIDGTPPINRKISPCVHGDHGTVAMLTNMIPKVVNAPPGLYTMKDIQVPSAFLQNPP